MMLPLLITPRADAEASRSPLRYADALLHAPATFDTLLPLIRLIRLMMPLLMPLLMLYANIAPYAITPY